MDSKGGNMGFDLYGQNKQKGETYFRSNVWGWRPIWKIVTEFCDDILDAEEIKRGNYNDFVKIDGAKSIMLATRLQSLIDDGTIKELPNNRIGELLDLLDEVEGKVVIWAQFQRDVHNIIQALHKEYGEGSFVDYYGLTPQEDRQKNIQKFQDPDSGVRFFVGTTQTGGYGITLTAASTMIYYSNGYDLEKRQQSEARIDRIGQEKPMTYIDIICENTVDTRIVKALRKKVDIATQIMGEELKAWI